MKVNHSTRTGDIIGVCLSFSNVKVCCVFSLESPHRGDSNEYIQQILSVLKRKSPKIISNTIMSAAMGFVLLGTQERVRNNSDKRSISV